MLSSGVWHAGTNSLTVAGGSVSLRGGLTLDTSRSFGVVNGLDVDNVYATQLQANGGLGVVTGNALSLTRLYITGGITTAQFASSGKVSIFDSGMAVTGGATVASGKVTASYGLSVQNNMILSQALSLYNGVSAMSAIAGSTMYAINIKNSLIITGTATLAYYSLNVITNNRVTVYSGSIQHGKIIANLISYGMLEASRGVSVLYTATPAASSQACYMSVGRCFAL